MFAGFAIGSPISLRIEYASDQIREYWVSAAVVRQLIIEKIVGGRVVNQSQYWSQLVVKIKISCPLSLE